jgi:valyl-tRNA synthetase
VRALEGYIKVLARVSTIDLLEQGARPSGEPSAMIDGIGEVFVPLKGVVEPSAVRERLQRDLGKIEKELKGVEAKLGRPDFVDKAPEEIVTKERERATALSERRATLQRHVAALEGNS